MRDKLFISLVTRERQGEKIELSNKLGNFYNFCTRGQRKLCQTLYTFIYDMIFNVAFD